MKILIFLLLPIFCIGQECRYEKNEIDKFTKSKILKTKWTGLWSTLRSGLAFKALRINDTKYLELCYSASSIYSINEGSELMFLMNNDSVVKLIADESKIADPHTSSYGTTWSIAVDYYLPESDYKVLLNGIVKTIRFYTPDGYIEKEIKMKRSKNLNKILKCI